MGQKDKLMAAGTPRDIVATVNARVDALLAMPDTKAAINAQGAEVQIMTPGEWSALLKSDPVTWRGIVQASGATIE